MEQRMFTKETRVLGIQAENKADAQGIKALLGLLVLRVPVLLVESIIELPYDLAGLHGDLHFLGKRGMFLLHKEFHAVGRVLQGIQLYDFRILSGLVLVVDPELLKVACDDVSRHLVQWHVVGVSFRLLIWREHDAPRLRLGLCQIL